MNHIIRRLSAMALALVLTVSFLLMSPGQTVQADESTAAAEEQNIQTQPFEERMYGVGSVSKVYVTTAVMQLAEDGRVDLDAPVTQYIPDFTMADERYTQITVRMLMNHTSGIMGSSFVNHFLYDDNDMSSHDRLLANLAGQRLKADPGQYAAYCNDGFTLLEMIVENVSGMSYTQYLDKYIVGPTGGRYTGTPISRFNPENAVPVYKFGNILYDYDYCMALGSGGVYATASEVAQFSSAFWTGNNILLSESSKEEMSSRWAENPYLDDNGLGWDYVERLQYENAGVTVMGKGGDIDNQHAHLMVAPDEEISVVVLSSGGSSMYNALMAQALLDVALEGKGIYVEADKAQSVEVVNNVAEEYAKYAGYYATANEIWSISFPDMKYMHLEKISYNNTVSEDYMLTSDGRFVRMETVLSEWANAGYPEDRIFRQDFNQVILSFDEAENGKVLIKKDEQISLNGLGSYTDKTYAAESLEENPISEETQAVWEARSGRECRIYNHKYSSTTYDAPSGKVILIEEVPGYMFLDSAGFGIPVKITGPDTARAFISVPSSVSRDQFDMTFEKDKSAEGNYIDTVTFSAGDKYRFVDEMPEFTAEVSRVSLHSENADWYRIGDDAAGTTITLTRPENSAVYVYNKYGEVIYSTHMREWNGGIPLPKGGSIVFLGEDGGSIEINR